MQFSAPSLVATVFGLIATDIYTTNTTELSTGYIDDSVVPIFNFLYKINDGKRIIQDYCEMIESDTTMFNMKSGTKPNCLNNHSFIDSNDTINIYRINEDLRTFFINKKNSFCEKQELICGELTILIKLYDLIQGAQDILLKDLENHNIWLNLRIIDFDNLYNLYTSSLDNIELLTNITLRRTQANVYLEREKTRIVKEINMYTYERAIDSINYFIGQPIKDGINYSVNGVADLFTSTISNILPELSFDSKLIIGILVFLLIRGRI